MNKPKTDWLEVVTFVVRILVSYIAVPFLLLHTADIMCPYYNTTVVSELFIGLWLRIAIEYLVVVVTDVWYDKKYRK